MSRWLAPNWSDCAWLGSIWKVYVPSETPTSARWAPEGTNGEVFRTDSCCAGFAALGDVASPEQAASIKLVAASMVSMEALERAIIGIRMGVFSRTEGKPVAVRGQRAHRIVFGTAPGDVYQRPARRPSHWQC